MVLVAGATVLLLLLYMLAAVIVAHLFTTPRRVQRLIENDAAI